MFINSPFGKMVEFPAASANTNAQLCMQLGIFFELPRVCERSRGFLRTSVCGRTSEICPILRSLFAIFLSTPLSRSAPKVRKGQGNQAY